MRTRNPSFSLRAFAKRAGVAPSAMSELLRGQRRVSFKLATRVAQKLLLDPTETHELLDQFDHGNRNASTSEPTDTDYVKLTADQFQLIADWTHYAILSLVNTTDFKPSFPWIAGRLGISESKAAASVDRLVRLNLLKIDGKTWRRGASRVHASDDVLNLSIQKAHLEDMEIAKTSLTQLPVELRDFTSISVPASPDALPRAKLAIRKFRQEIANILTESRGTEVYQMSVYLYPLTQVRPIPQGEKK